jgi:hypothetical protein
MKTFDDISALEQNDAFHMARLLLIMLATKEGGEPDIEGLTKLAKLDFLLRYPVFLERALDARGVSPKRVDTEEHERMSVESAMVRYRFGPWDQRYRRFLNLLSAQGLVKVTLEGRKIVIGLTAKGIEVSAQIAQAPEFEKTARRAQLLKYFSFTATHLMRFIYATFPEIGSLRSGKRIPA